MHIGSYTEIFHVSQFPDYNGDDMGDTYLGVMSDWCIIITSSSYDHNTARTVFISCELLEGH